VTASDREVIGRAELGLLERSQDRAGKLLGLLVSSNFEERRTRLSEQQGQVAGLAIKRILDAMLDRVLSVLDDGEERRSSTGDMALDAPAYW
jgi:hypothetical protein